MQACVREALRSGAWGLSTGLEYPPGLHADTAELIGLASEAAAVGGMYHTHLRSEGDGLIEAVAEAIEIAERSGAVGVLTHFKAVHRRNWGKAARALELIEAARSRGVRVYADQFPFADAEVPLIPDAAWSATRSSAEGGDAKLAEALEAIPVGALLELYAAMAALPSLEPERRRFLEARPGLLAQNDRRSAGPRDALRGSWAHGVGRVVRRPPGAGQSGGTGALHRAPGRPGRRCTDQVAGGGQHRAARRRFRNHHRGVGALRVGGPCRWPRRRTPWVCPWSTPRSGSGWRAPRAMADILSHEDLEQIMRRDYVATGSDGDYPYFGAGIDPMGGTQHIRTYASFTMKLRRYAIDARGDLVAARDSVVHRATCRDPGLERSGVAQDGALGRHRGVRSRQPRASVNGPASPQVQRGRALRAGKRAHCRRQRSARGRHGRSGAANSESVASRRLAKARCRRPLHCPHRAL